MAGKQSAFYDTKRLEQRDTDRLAEFVRVGERIKTTAAGDVKLGAKSWSPISAPLAAVINCALDPDPMHRFQSAAEMLKALQNTKKGRIAFFRAHARLKLRRASRALLGGEGGLVPIVPARIHCGSDVADGRRLDYRRRRPCT